MLCFCTSGAPPLSGAAYGRQPFGPATQCSLCIVGSLRSQVMADAARSKGNDAFAARDFAAALAHYTAALEVDPKDHVAYAGRLSSLLSDVDGIILR